jgi:PAS domain S-box-containing protein
VVIAVFWLLGGSGIMVWVRRLVRSAQVQQAMLDEVEESSQRFHQLFQSSPAPMFIHRDGCFTEVNLAAAHLLDADEPGQLVGLEVLSFIHPEYRYLVGERIHRIQDPGHIAPAVEEVFLTYRGREVWVQVQTAAIDLPGGPAILVFAQDLSERRRAEEERRKMEAEIQHAQKLDSLGSLAGGIAHDMNNVLGAILGMATLLQMKREGDEALLKSLRTIENAASRGRDLVKGLTDFARKGLQQAQRLDLNALLREELDLLVRTSRQRFTFEVELDETLPPIMGERSSLGSAFMNLAVNAFDAMPRGGTFRVRTFQDGDRVCLEVADTGEGIPADILSRVTDPFFTTKPQGRGTGLGLAMVYGTVKAHGGSLDIQSEVGKGTRIRLHLPALVTRTLPGEPEEPAEVHPDRHLRILLVDDDELIRDILPPMIEQLGHRVEIASSGLEALRRLDAGLEVDLVILDHNMPGMTGAETLPRLFQLRPTVRVLISTGFLDTDLKILLADFPAVATLQKPFSLDELRMALQAISAG